MFQHLCHSPAERGPDAENSKRRSLQQDHACAESRDLFGRRLHLLLRLAMLANRVVRVESAELCWRTGIHKAIVHWIQDSADLELHADCRTSDHRCGFANLPLCLSRRRRSSPGRDSRQHSMRRIRQMEERPGRRTLDRWCTQGQWLNAIRNLHAVHLVCALRQCRMVQRQGVVVHTKWCANPGAERNLNLVRHQHIDRVPDGPVQ